MESVTFTREHIKKAKEVFNTIISTNKKNNIRTQKIELKPKASLYCNIQSFAAKTEEDKAFWKNVQLYITKNY